MENRIALLVEKGGKSLLEFSFEDEKKYSVDLNSDDQSKLRELFYKIIEDCILKEFEYTLQVEEGYSKQLYIDICASYIKQLNSEIAKIRQEIPIEINEKTKE